MSRMGTKPVTISPKVNVEIKDGKITVKGAKGTLSYDLPPHFSVEQSADKKELLVKSEEDKITDKHEKRLMLMKHGMIRSLLNGMVTGVEKGFVIELEFVGVGYRAQLQGQTLTMSLGYSKPRVYKVPANVKVSMKDQTHVTLESADKQAVGQVAAIIRSQRVPDAYHGKGVRYLGEQITLKEGKKV